MKSSSPSVNNSQETVHLSWNNLSVCMPVQLCTCMHEMLAFSGVLMFTKLPCLCNAYAVLMYSRLYVTDISYQYTELRPAEDDSEKDEEEATLELTLDYGDNDDGDTHPPPSKKPATEVVKKEEERYGMIALHTLQGKMSRWGKGL